VPARRTRSRAATFGWAGGGTASAWGSVTGARTAISTAWVDSSATVLRFDPSAPMSSIVRTAGNARAVEAASRSRPAAACAIVFPRRVCLPNAHTSRRRSARLFLGRARPAP
jgi:hypothetical protein